ncbi:histone-like nucleoid-structuring protein Lsr2 [Streptomyces sp. NPDC048389]|uniref:Lsr2 family DNA-binding protein n=1 Tax=Streptomyces sp. NPDC048389 TaxID=3154622 RepID=UPI0034525824
MNQPPAPAADQGDAPSWTVGKLLAWADAHSSKTIRTHSAKAREHIEALRGQLLADHEIAKLDAEAARLEQQLAEVREKRAGLQPGKARAPRSYHAATVRAWAKEQGIDCPAPGRVPAAIVDQWRTTQAGA